MSEPIDDKALDEYLKGDSVVSQRYRELGADQVPSELDRRVLTQARAAVTSRTVSKPFAKSRAWMRWSAPVALAASAVLVLTIVIESGVQEEAAFAPEPQATADVAAEAERKAELHGLMRDEAAPALQPAAPAPMVNESIGARVSSRADAVEAREVTVTAQRRREMAQNSAVAAVTAQDLAIAPPAVVPIEAPAEPASDALSRAPIATTAAAGQRHTDRDAEKSVDLSEVVVTGNVRPKLAAQGAGPRSTIPPGSFATEAASAKEQDESPAYSDPQRWLEDIRQLRKDGKSREADLEWERFRKSFPDYPVSDSDSAKTRK